MVYVSATVLAAVLTWAAFPPLDLGFLAFVAPAPFLWALRQIEDFRHSMWLGAIYATVLWGAMLYWILHLGAVAWIPLTVGFGLYGAAYGLLVYAARRLAPWRWWIVAVGGWALWDFLRARWPFAGFPWGSLGYAVGSLAWPRGAAQWVGASGLAVLAVAVAAGLALIVDGGRRNAGFAAYPLAVALILTAAGALWAPGAGGDVVRVAIIQGSSPCPGANCANEKQLIYESHIALTRSLPAGEFDLVVWPENAVGGGFEPIGNATVAAAVISEAQRLGAYLMISGTRVISEEEFVNSNLLYSPDGELLGEYLKRHPVPFGEYVPFRDYLDWIPQLDQVPRDMVRGETAVVFPLPEGSLGSVISFEGAFAREIRNEVKSGAQLITVNTNEASYGRSPASDQLIGMVRLSAAENGIDIAHAAITGKSAVITASGSVVDTTGLFTEEVLTGELRWRTGGRTFYTAAGDWLQVGALLLVPLALLVRNRSKEGDYIFAS